MKPITLSDAIYKVEVIPRKVISKAFVLSLLQSIESEDGDRFDLAQADGTKTP